jgi:hypothetical protein
MMNSQSYPVVDDSRHVLPSQVTTLSGVIFDPREDCWSYRESVFSMNLNFGELKEITSELTIHLKLVLIWYVQNNAPNYVASLFNTFKNFLFEITVHAGRPLDRITINLLINFRAILSSSQRQRFGVISILVKKWYKLGIPGVDAGCIAFLNQIRIGSGLAKGASVTSLDPIKGPFTNIELEGIQFAFNNAFDNGLVSLGEYILGWLFMLLGQRPIQYALLKVCDVCSEVSASGVVTYWLKIPRVKQGYEDIRAEYKERALTPQIGSLLVKYAAIVERDFLDRLPNPRQAPLFPQMKSAEFVYGFEYHLTAASLGRRLVDILRALEVLSERTGVLMHIAPSRFRKTIGTRAAEEGHGELVIAELLDHSDIQHVGVYVKATSEMITRIDRAIALQMAPLAQAFAGVLVDNSKSEGEENVKRRITGPSLTSSFKPVGNCGKFGFCGFLAPIACYTCNNFNAWLDGPHETILGKLIEERDRLSGTTDKRIAAVNDRTILAVAQVVAACKKNKG